MFATSAHGRATIAGGDIDDALVRARRGDTSALSELFVACTPKLVRMVELRMDNAQRQRCDPSDVVQDALLEATQRFAQWGEQRELPFHVTKNLRRQVEPFLD